MDRTYAPLLEASVEIAAPVEVVWALASDVRRMHEWNPQVTSTRLRDGATEVALGVGFTNRNRAGDLEWTTRAAVVRFDVGRELAFRVEENGVVWSFELAPAGRDGTRLVQRRETPEGISELSLEWTDRFFGGQAAFTASLRGGMRETLDRIKASAES